LLIVGPDGSGKTALSRVIAGVWNAGHGTMYRPPASDIMFMTALPYLPAMTLRQALCFADGELCQDDARLMQVLTVVNLQDLPQRSGGMDVEQNWRQMLSLNEQQRLTLARVILRRPMYVVIDEATAALEAEHVQLLYALLASLGATVISAGNSGGLVKYHAQVLELAGDGSWQLHPADKYTPKPVVRISGLIDKLGKGE
jgi:vitamin B12/bleomycin/antimicrobial peptide transport system ATP-binding/permease protein